MSFLRRTPRAAAPRLASRERVLAWARAGDGTVLAGTRDALHLVARQPSGAPRELRLPWEQVDAAGWDEPTSTLRVSLVGGVPGEASHAYRLEEARALLELLRERVTASVVLQRHVLVPGHGGVTVVARRAPSGAVDVVWSVRHDDGTDPSDPVVRDAVEQALADAKDEVGQR